MLKAIDNFYRGSFVIFTVHPVNYIKIPRPNGDFLLFPLSPPLALLGMHAAACSTQTFIAFKIPNTRNKDLDEALEDF